MERYNYLAVEKKWREKPSAMTVKSNKSSKKFRQMQKDLYKIYRSRHPYTDEALRVLQAKTYHCYLNNFEIF